MLNELMAILLSLVLGANMCDSQDAYNEAEAARDVNDWKVDQAEFGRNDFDIAIQDAQIRLDSITYMPQTDRDAAQAFINDAGDHLAIVDFFIIQAKQKRSAGLQDMVEAEISHGSGDYDDAVQQCGEAVDQFADSNTDCLAANQEAAEGYDDLDEAWLIMEQFE